MVSESLEDDHNKIINDMTIGLSAVSLIGSSAIILSFLLFPKLRTFALQLVVWLSVSDFGGNITDLLGNPANGSALCYAQGWLKQFFRCAEVTWTTVISYTLYQTIMHQERSTDRQMWPLHLYAWGVPFLFSVIPSFTNNYGQAGPWCWITETNVQELDAGTAYRFFLFYIPTWIAIGYNIVVYFKVIRTVKCLYVGAQTAQSKKLLNLCDRLKMYPLIMVICWSFATINRIQNTIEPQNPMFVLFFLHSMLISLQGLFNAVAYGLTPTVRQAWKRAFKDIFSSGGSGAGERDEEDDDESSLKKSTEADSLTIGTDLDNLPKKDTELL
mmetsp:Transcript_31114/g.40056  ORF Transcript_31114/g.40056 Transcript_31114/m.40056 type:complete len:328 (+) Transcript_31114:108-1091(+)